MRWTSCWLVLIALLLGLSVVASAQSGRKQKKTVSEPPPQGVKMPESKSDPVAGSSDSTGDKSGGHSDSDQAAKDEADEKERARRPAYYVGISNLDAFSNIPLAYLRFPLDGCVRELRRGYSREVTDNINMTRSEAIEAAKRDERTYVVYLELDARSSNQGGSGNVEVRFYLYEPKTAKVIASGFGYPQMNAGRVPLPIGTSRLDVQMELMGRDVARQVLERVRKNQK
jgi:hypothetical protein